MLKVTIMGAPPLTIAAHTESIFVPVFLVPGVRIRWPGSGPDWHEIAALPVPDPRPKFEHRLQIRLVAHRRPEGEIVAALPWLIEVDLDSVGAELACRRLKQHKLHNVDDNVRLVAKLEAVRLVVTEPPGP